MALVLNDRVRETSITTGTGAMALGGAVVGFQTFAAGVGNSNTCYYAISLRGGAEFETGLGTLDGSSANLTRTTVFQSSNSDSVVSFSAGTKDVFVTLPASKAVFEDATTDNVTLTADLSVGDDLTVNGGVIEVKNTGAQSVVRFYCESSNAHYAEIKAPAHSAFSGNVSLTLPAVTDTLVGLAATQTLTNKTLTTPVLTTPIANAGVQLKNGATSAGFLEFFEDSDNGTNKVTLIGPAATADVTLTLPSATDTLVGKATTDTLTNKTLTTPVLTTPIANAGVQLKNGATSAGFLEFFEDSDNGTNKVTLIGPASTADVTLTLPAATDTLIGKATTDTLTNKSIDSDNNTITNLVNADIKASAAIAFSKMADLTASRALVSDGNGDVSVSAVTSTEVGYLDGVTSAIQTQLDTKTTPGFAVAMAIAL
jgi:preprotein translocase subunit Sec61beta